MTIEIVTIPCRSDNYAFLIVEDGNQQAVLVDAPETAPIAAELEERGLALSDILITHHHDDHIAGVTDLKGRTTRVIGGEADVDRLPQLNLAVSGGDRFSVLGMDVDVIDVPGHTTGHIAFYIAEAQAAFTGDSLMAMGCGRLFEGTPDQMWESLSKLAALPPETNVYSGHEYTAANARFAMTVMSTSPALQDRIKQIDTARSKNLPTVPSLLAEECATNPFLRAHLPEVKASLGMSDAGDIEVFAEIRARKDRF